MNVPENLVRHPQRQSTIRDFKTRLREETPSSPARWLPSPPPTRFPLKSKGGEQQAQALMLFDGPIKKGIRVGRYNNAG